MKKRLTISLAITLALVLSLAPTLALAAGYPDSLGGLGSTLAKAGKRKALARSVEDKNAAPRRQLTTGPLAGQSATLMPDGRLLKIGGLGTAGLSATSLLEDPRTGDVAAVAGGLTYARAWHTATLLPDGAVLIVGGQDAAGNVIDTAEIFSPHSQIFEAVTESGITPRAHHSATLLSDERVLIAGGISTGKKALNTGQLWDFRTRTAAAVPTRLHTARYDHTASLLPDGGVMLWGGKNAAGAPIAGGEIYDPVAGDFSLANDAPTADDGPAVLRASIPSDGSTGISVDALISLRFSRPMGVETVNYRSVTVTGPGGQVTVNVVPAEGGMLAFVTPLAPLAPSTPYTVSIAGALDTSKSPVAPISVQFTTAAQGIPDGTVWTPDDRNYHGDWTSGLPPSPWQNYAPLQGTPGSTALAGQVLRYDGWPMPGVVMKINSVATVTDETGRFVLSGVPQGRNTLILDCRPASNAATTYGFFMEAIDVPRARVTNALPYTIFVPVLDTKNAVPLPVPTKKEVVATTPMIPGLEVHIPKKAILRNVDGNPITSMTITPVPIDRGPFPLPLGVRFPVYFTLQLGGTKIERPDSLVPPDIHLVFPNYSGARPGSRIDFWTYDAAGVGWLTYGHGTVTQDGKQIAPDQGVVIRTFTCASIGGPVSVVAPGTCAYDGDPVDLSTGLFVYRQTDLVLPDIIPIALTRTYRPNYTLSGPFGIGGFHPYELFLVGDGTNYSYVDLMLPDGSRIHYTRTSSGTSFADAIMVHTTTPTAYYQSTLTAVGSGSAGAYWDLKMKDGTLLRFSVDFREDAPLTMIRDRNGNHLDIQRNLSSFAGVPSHYITSITTPNGRWVSFTYDSNFRVTQATDNIGRTVSYAYDSSGRLTQVTDAIGGITQYTYDSANRMLTVKNPRQIVYVTNQYDTNGRVIQQTHVDGGVYQFAYTVDGNNNVTQTTVTDPRGNVRQVSFNPSGYPLVDTRALGKPEQETVSYNRQSSTNLMLSKTDPLGRVTAYGYDTMGNVTSITRLSGTPSAVTATYTYEPMFNQVASITDPLNHLTTFAYDSVDNLLSVTDALGERTTFTYNGAGQRLTVTDPLNNTTQFAYDRGDLVSVTDPLGNRVTRFQDGGGRILSITNAIGQVIRFELDPLNRLTRMTDPLQGQTSFAYDGDNNLLRVTDARGNVTSYTYDNMDRMQTRTDPLMHIETYSYDLAGNATTFTDRRGKVTSFTYDGLNRQIFAGFGTVTSGGSSTYESTVTSTYDAASECGCAGVSGRLRQVVDSISGTIAYTYDDFDRVASEATPQGTVSYTYDAMGRRATMTVPGQSTVTYTYDNANRLTQVAQGSSTVGIGYDAAGRPASVTLPNGAMTQYTYDAASRMAGISYVKNGNSIGNLTYQYDAIGRRTSMGGSFAQTGLPQVMASATYNPDNQQSAIGSQTFSYDADGNMIGDGTNTYTWDARNRLVSMSGSGLAASFQYDALGRRVSKTINGATTSFLYDGENAVQEQVGGSASANMLTGFGPDEVFTRTDSSGTWGLLTDALGNTSGLTDSTGTVQTRYSYEPFGKTTASGATVANPAQYTRRENDGTGLYYYRARYYSPANQRFISEDPIGFGGGPDLYAYAGNDPIGQKDPMGLMTLIQCISAGAGVGGLVGLGVGAVVGVATGPALIFSAFVGSATGVVIGAIVGAILCNPQPTCGKLIPFPTPSANPTPTPTAPPAPPPPPSGPSGRCTLVLAGPKTCRYKCPNGVYNINKDTWEGGIMRGRPCFPVIDIEE